MRPVDYFRTPSYLRHSKPRFTFRFMIFPVRPFVCFPRSPDEYLIERVNYLFTEFTRRTVIPRRRGPVRPPTKAVDGHVIGRTKVYPSSARTTDASTPRDITATRSSWKTVRACTQNGFGKKINKNTSHRTRSVRRPVRSDVIPLARACEHDFLRRF